MRDYFQYIKIFLLMCLKFICFLNALAAEITAKLQSDPICHVKYQCKYRYRENYR
jgi:hypothetical protein